MRAKGSIDPIDHKSMLQSQKYSPQISVLELTD